MNIINALPCPFCEKDNLSYDSFNECVYCEDCGVTGPRSCDNVTKAIEAWNKLPRRDSSSEDEELKPCPYCGCKRIIEEASMGYYKLICSNCYLQAPLKEERSDAIAAWNSLPRKTEVRKIANKN